MLLAIQLFSLSSATSSLLAQTFTVLHTFTGGGDGAAPEAGIIRDGSGNLYGTTSAGGAFDAGAVFEVDAHGKETILHRFWGGEGGIPLASVIRTSDGTLYSTTWQGGTLEGGACVHGCGTVFKLDTTGKLSVLHAFSGGADGGDLDSALIADGKGNLYGVTEFGGNGDCDGRGCGVVFKLDGKGKETVLHAFTDRGGGDGAFPYGGLVRDREGNLYGVTMEGGGADFGTVFNVDASGKETILHNFAARTDGAFPEGPLLRDSQGNLYGVTQNGGSSACGIVFKVDTRDNETILYNFTGTTDGCHPSGGLTRDDQGNLYGVTQGAYNGSSATIYRLDTSGGMTVLYKFTERGGGEFALGPLIRDKSGTLYGAAWNIAGGMVFKLTP